MIGDTDPEDAYDVTDPIPVRVANLVARIDLVVRRATVDVDSSARLRRVLDDLGLIRGQLADLAERVRHVL